MKAKCVKCQRTFSYQKQGVRKRVVCDDCQEKNGRELRKRRQQRNRISDREESARDLDADGVTRMKRTQLAVIEGIARSNVHKFERQALAKIRQHPEARRLFELWKAEGCPTPIPRDPAEQLLEWNTHLAQWWEVYEQINVPDCAEEALQCRREIEKFFKVLKRAINESN